MNKIVRMLKEISLKKNKDVKINKLNKNKTIKLMLDKNRTR